MKTASSGRANGLLIAALTIAVASLSHAAIDQKTISTLEATGSAFAEIARHAMEAVVFIQVERTIVPRGAMRMPRQPELNDPYEYFGDDFMRRFFGPRAVPEQPQRRFRQMGQGSGFLVSPDGEILTNHHVVGDADKITVKLSDGRHFEAERVGSDPKSEVAVIRIKGENFPYLKMGDADKMKVGEWVLAVGNPFGLNATVTAGIVSAKGRSNIGIADYEDFIQTDAAINPGNSGGPLINIRGEVIGINTAIYSRSGGYMGIGFAIPINMARHIRDQLVDTGRVSRGYLGVYIQELTRELADGFGMPDTRGIIVSDIIPDSPAEKAGIQQGDIITRLNDRQVESVPEFRNNIASAPPGSTMRLTIIRDGNEEVIEAQTAPLPGEEETAEQAAPAQMLEKLGLAVQDLNAELAARMGIDAESGVVVTGVEPGSTAERAGLRPGQLILEANRKPVANEAALRQQISAAASRSSGMLLRIREGAASRYLVIRLETE